MDPPPMTKEERRFVESRRVGHLATADAAGLPHVVPVCFALALVPGEGAVVYVAIDAKPKRVLGARLKRLRNIAANPSAAIVFDHYDEDWTRLGWVLLRGRAEILTEGAEHAAALAALATRYVQYTTMSFVDAPVIALRVANATSWGALAPPADQRNAPGV